MADQDFEQRLARGLHDYSEGGLRPYDALAIARSAMRGGGGRAPQHGRRGSGVPVWFRSLVLAGLLVVLLVAAAFVGGLIQLPTPIVVPTPTATVSGEHTPSPSPQPTPTDEPSPTPSPDGSPSPSPTPTGEPSPSPSPTVSPSPSPTPSPAPVAGWREVGGFPAGQSDSFSDATYGPAGFVIVAVGSGGGNSWVSADGLNWTRSTDTGFDGARHVVARGGEYVAIGTVAQGQGRRVWRSTDGLNWALLTVSPVLEFVWDLTVDDGLLVAAGTNADFDAALVWTSTDGVTWTSIAAPEASSELDRVAARGGDIVALGDDSGGYGRVIWFRAAHSGEWVRYEPYGEDHDGRLVDLATDGRLFVAVGYEDDFDTGVRTPTIRSSADGMNWTETRVSDSGVDVFEQVVVLPDGRLLAVGSSRNWSGSGNRLTMREVGYSYVSADATTWGPRQQIWERTEQVGSDIGDQIERYRPVAAGGPGAIVADEDRPIVFFAPLADLR